MEILSGIFELMVCPSCKENNVTLTENNVKKTGLASFSLVTCCNVNTAINLRMVYGMRDCGQGYAGMEKYCTIVNMSKPITKNCNHNGLFC